jgi:hypothetical protein
MCNEKDTGKDEKKMEVASVEWSEAQQLSIPRQQDCVNPLVGVLDLVHEQGNERASPAQGEGTKVEDLFHEHCQAKGSCQWQARFSR